MLAPSPTTTPRRPLPPAKARKSTSLNFSRLAPPPPYEPPLEDMILNSPITVTTQLMHAAQSSEGIGIPGTPGMDDWMNEKSRDELSGLLLKADGIIKSRETELSLTSALCKTLYSDNVTLKAKHEALLARLPGTGSTPIASPTTSQLHLDVPPAFDQVSVDAAMSPDQSPLSLSIPPHPRRTRRISVSPADLALLSDQNAELIDKLEQLEAESLKADQAGKRKLHKLEQEIQTLREELDKTQARGVELEEQAKAAVSVVTAQKRKEERDARLQAMRDKSTTSSASDNSLEEIKDFAPPSTLSRSSPIKRSISSSSAFTDNSHPSPSRSLAHTLGNTSLEEEEEEVFDDPQSYFPTPPGSNRDLPPVPEYAIISQLLAKIRELEETNAQIKEQQKATEERMRAARWDAESIRRVYDCLDDGDVDLEIQVHDDDDESPNDLEMPPLPSTHTIRFSSIRRSIAGNMNKLLDAEADVFAGGISKEMQSTVREDANRPSGIKSRRTVVGLFDPDPDTSGESAAFGEYPPLLRVSSAFRSLDADVSTWSSAATDGLGMLSPTFSPLQTPVDAPGRTLGSELGSELGDDWAERGINHHLRASSLCDLAGLNSTPVSPSESVVVLPPITLTAMEAQEEDEDQHRRPSTPPHIPNLQFNVEPPTPTPERLKSPAALRQAQLSKTVRARTNRWVEGRFPQPRPSQGSFGEIVLRRRPSANAMDRGSMTNILAALNAEVLDETFDHAATQVRRVASGGSFSSRSFPPTLPLHHLQDAGRIEEEKDGNDSHDQADRSVSLRQDASVVDPLGNKHTRFVGFVLEAWLWLQFIIVVALFLFAMAKRGPKVVLEAERRGAHRATPRS